jgi:hypothetical protein
METQSPTDKQLTQLPESHLNRFRGSLTSNGKRTGGSDGQGNGPASPEWEATDPAAPVQLAETILGHPAVPRLAMA